jgi:hypothetical protein
MVISGTDRVKNEKILHTVKEKKNIVGAIKRRKHNWTGHILRRNRLLNHVTEGKIQRDDEEKDVNSYNWKTLTKRQDTAD